MEQEESLLLPPPKINLLKPLLIIFAVMLVVTSSVLAVYFTRKGRFSLREKAVGEGKLICMPIDLSGNMVDDVSRYSRIKVINNTGETVHVQWGTSFCPLSQWQVPPPTCRENKSIYAEVLAPGAERIFEMNVPCMKYGQLDVWQNPDTSFNPITEKSQRIEGAECFNSIKNTYWYSAYQGGPSIAYTFAKNEEVCPVQTVCSSLSGLKVGSTPPALTDIKVGDTLRFIITPSGGGIEEAAIRIMKNSVKVTDLTRASPDAGGNWSIDYTIPVGGEGEYEIFGFIKVGGRWR